KQQLHPLCGVNLTFLFPKAFFQGNRSTRQLVLGSIAVEQGQTINFSAMLQSMCGMGPLPFAYDLPVLFVVYAQSNALFYLSSGLPLSIKRIGLVIRQRTENGC